MNSVIPFHSFNGLSQITTRIYISNRTFDQISHFTDVLFDFVSISYGRESLNIFFKKQRDKNSSDSFSKLLAMNDFLCLE